MKQRPLLFIVIGMLHILEPVVKVLYFKATTPFDFGTIISNIFAISGPRELFEFWLLFPIGGIALLGVKKWSYPTFVGVQLYSIYSHITYIPFSWPYVSKIPFYSSLVLLFINLAIIAYFFLPAVRRPFYDKKMRWWEHRKRYTFPIPCTISINNPQQKTECQIENISLSGAFINYREFLEVGTYLQIHIDLDSFQLYLEAEMVSQHNFNNERGIGVKFHFHNIWENLATRRLIRIVEKECKQREKNLVKLAS